MAQIKITELVVIRHGETVWNQERRHQGHLDSDLSELGVRQAKAVAGRLAKLSFAALYSSDLKRAFHTAQYIAKITGHSILLDKRLRERDYGIFRGMTLEEIQEKFPKPYVRFKSGDPDYVIPEGESGRQKYDRVIECVREIVKAHEGRRVVIVTHGGALDALFRHTVGLELSIPRRYKLFNVSLNTFFVQDGTWSLGTWGDIGHLTEMETIDDE
jgi:2,3-bisphosphoglycerate-dependent phosphoglycerate mutase